MATLTTFPLNIAMIVMLDWGMTMIDHEHHCEYHKLSSEISAESCPLYARNYALDYALVIHDHDGKYHQFRDICGILRLICPALCIGD